MQKALHNLYNLIEQTTIRIPFFLSPTPTSTLSIPIGNQVSTMQAIQQQWICEQGLSKWKIVGYQWKLYYDKHTIPYKTLILLFQGFDSAEKFFSVFAKLEKEAKLGYDMYYCRSILQGGVDMHNLLYVKGRISIQNPQSPTLRNIIKEISKLIVVEGIRAEQEIKKHQGNILPPSMLAFMDPKYLSSQSNYYRWRVHSYLHNGGQHDYSQSPFQISANGPIYIPPPIWNSSEKTYNSILSHPERVYITKLLDSLNSNKYFVEEAMVFFVSTTHAAVELAAILAVAVVQACSRFNSDKDKEKEKEKQKEKEKEKEKEKNHVKHLVGLFYLISDILFNSTATIYRDIFTILLPPLLSRVPNIPEIESKLSELVSIWDRKFIFEQQFLQGLRQLLHRQLPSYNATRMQQMTRSEHEAYKELLEYDSVDKIQELCWKHGIVYDELNMQESVRNLAAVLAVKARGLSEQMEPAPGAWDGEVLTDKDLGVIRKKECRVVIVDDLPVKLLFEKDKEKSRSINFDKD